MQIKNSAVSMIIEAEDPKELGEIKLQFLGRSGKLTLAVKEIIKIPPEKRKAVGILINDVKKVIEMHEIAQHKKGITINTTKGKSN